MKIDFPLLSRLVGENILFPCVHLLNIFPPERDLSWRGVRWGNFARSQCYKWVTQTLRKTALFCCVRNVSSLLHNLIYLSLLNSFLFLSTFYVYLKSLNNYVLRCLGLEVAPFRNRRYSL